MVAADIGSPVVLKLCSETITPKTDVDGVPLHVADAAAAVGVSAKTPPILFSRRLWSFFSRLVPGGIALD